MKEVTIMAFGPSLFKVPYETQGEVWSMNTCLDLFTQETNKHLLKTLTAIFEMHAPKKREWMISILDCMPYFLHLSNFRGRVIMQEPHSLIANSESYPLAEVEEKLGIAEQMRYWGRDFWGGTPPYCLALALYEGYEKIHLVGCDCLDPKHIRQKRSMSYLMGWAKANGVITTGVTINTDTPIRRYGYDYGPEWDDRQNKELFDGWPIEIKFKGIK